MSTQAHQTQTQTQTAAQEQAQTSAPEHEQAGGNQQALDEAGLASEETETDTSLLGPYAELILSAMPLAVALPMALPFVANPLVREWILGLAPEAIAKVLEGDESLSRTLLEHVWPAGIGFEIAGFADLGLNVGAGIEGARRAVNTDGTVLDEQLDARFSAKLDTGVGGGATDAFGNGAQAGADAALAVAVEVNARTYSPMPAHWWTLLDKTPLDVLVDYLSGVRGPAQLETGVAPGEAFELQVTTSGGAEVSAGAAAINNSALPDWLGSALQPYLGDSGAPGTGLDLSRLQPELEAQLGAAGKLKTVERVSPSGLDWGVQLEGTVSGMVAGGLGTMLSADENAALQEVARLGGGGGWTATVHAGLQVDAGLLDGQSLLDNVELAVGGVDLAESTAWGAVEQTNTRSYPNFTALWSTQTALDAMSDRDGAPEATSLDEVLASGATLSKTRATQVALDPAQLADVAPGIWGTVLSQLGLDRTHVGVTSTDAELALEGTVEVDHAALQAAADAGVVAPGPTAGNALEETAEALLAAATGDVVPGWATPWADALEAQGPGLWTQSQVKGWAGVGAGGSVSLGEGVKGNGSAGATAKVLVEIPTTPDQHRQLAEAAR